MKCSHCESLLSQVTLRPITLDGGKGHKWKGVSYSCPLCLKIVNVGFDPLTLQSDLVDAIRDAFRKN